MLAKILVQPKRVSAKSYKPSRSRGSVNQCRHFGKHNLPNAQSASVTDPTGYVLGPLGFDQTSDIVVHTQNAGKKVYVPHGTELAAQPQALPITEAEKQAAPTLSQPVQNSDVLGCHDLLKVFDYIHLKNPGIFQKRNPKAGPWVANRLSESHAFGNKFVTREGTFRTLIQSMVKRARSKSTCKTQNPLMAVSGATGSGKTRFLNEVAALFDDPTKREAAFALAGISNEDQEIMNALCNSLGPISVTYGPGSKYCEDYDAKACDGLALRVVFRTFFLHGDLDTLVTKYRELWNRPLKVELSPLFDALDYLQGVWLPQGMNGFFVMVDDLQLADAGGMPTQMGHPSPVERITQEIGQMLKANPFGAILSTTNVTPLVKTFPGSGRCIEWIPLKGATPADTVTLLDQVKEDQKPILRLFSALTSGHFGTLELGLAKWMDWKGWNVDHLQLADMDTWAHLRTEIPPSRELVIEALSGISLNVSETIGDRTLSSWAESGACSVPMERFLRIPAIPILSLYDQRNQLGLDQLKQLLERCLIGTAKYIPTRPLEAFHIYWENLHRALPSRGPNVKTLVQFYGGKAISSQSYSLNPCLDSFRFEFKPKPNGVKSLQTSLGVFINSKMSVKELVGSMYLGYGHPDPIDSWYLEILPNGQLVFVGISNEPLKHDTQTSITNPDIQERHVRLMETLFGKPHQSRPFEEGDKQYVLSPNHVVLVVATLQPISMEYRQADKEIDEYEEYNVILLGEEQLGPLYTPTLLPLPTLWQADVGRY